MDLNKIQKGLWVACIVLSVICMFAAAWLLCLFISHEIKPNV